MPRSTTSQPRGVTARHIVCALACLVGIYLALELLPHWQAPSPPALHPALQVFFTTPTLSYPDRPGQRPPSPLLDAFVADIDAARASIDLAVFDLDLEAVTGALVRAQRRGVVVRVALDSENLTTPEVAAVAGHMQTSGVQVFFDQREPFMHHKFMVVDQTRIWAGSWNITENDTYRNNNNMLRIVSRSLAARYHTQFEHMVQGGYAAAAASGSPLPPGGVPIEVYFSPDGGGERRILAHLVAARRSIHFMAFSYTSDAVGAAMVDAVARGVVVGGVMETTNARGSGAELGRLRAGGAAVIEDGNCYLLHHKVLIIDERVVITGSYNFTASADHDNNENLLIIEHPALARWYLEEYQRLYRQAQAPSRCG